MDRKGIAQSLIGSFMDKRKKKYEAQSAKTGERRTGGMLDIIYKKKKEREKMMSDISGMM